MQIIFVIILAALVALLGKDRKIGYGWSFVLCVFLSPIIGLIIILFSKKNTDVEFIEVSQDQENKES
jgi:Na+/melibiose symporter-like transporter